MVNDTPLAPTGPSVEEKRRLLVQKLQERAQRGVFPLSFSQQRLWFLHRMDPDSPAYHIPLALRASGDLDVRVLRRALRLVVKRHDALRTTFTERDGRPVQVVGAEAPDVLIKVDLRGLAEADRERELARLLGEAATRPFDLERGPLLRALAVRLDDEEWGLLFTLHHIVADGWSMGVLVRDLSELYAAEARGLPPELAPMGTQYPEYALWQRGWLKGEVLERETAFWRGQLAGAPRLLELPTDRPRPAVAGQHGENRRFTLGPQTSHALSALAREEGATLFMTLLSAWQLLLGRYAGQNDVLVGTPTAGRTREELEGVVGFFVNTLVIRARLDDGMSFRQLLRQVRETTLGAYAHQHLPFEKLVEEMGVERTLAHTPLFQAMFSLQNNEHVELTLGGTRFESMETGTAAAKFDLNLSAGEGTEGIRGVLSFRTDLFDGTTAERMLDHFTALLEAVAANPDRRLGDHTLLGDAERRRVVEEWNRTERPFPETCLHRLWEAQAARTPDAVAVLHGDRAVTYAQLDRAANRLAHALQRRGVGPEVRVALHLDNGPEQLTGILGVLKAGGAYVPLDTASPADRLAYVLEDSGAALVLADDPAVLPAGVPALCLTADAFADEPEDAPACAAGPRNLVYVIYTSGSTGRPKGVLVEHRGVCNTVLNYVEAYGIHADARVLHFAPVHFDASVTDLFTPLFAGATLVTAPREALIPGRGAPGDAARPAGDARQLHPLRPGRAPLRGAAGAGGGDDGRRGVHGGAGGPLGARPPLHQRLRPHGDERPRHRRRTCTDGTRTPPIGRPVANARLYVLDAVRQPAARRRAGRAVHRRRRRGPRLPGPRRRSRPSGSSPIPFAGSPGARLYRIGRPGALAAGRRAGLPGAGGLPGEDPRLPHRAGRGRGGAARARRRGGRRRRGPRGRGAGAARLVAYVVPRAGGRGRTAAARLREHLKARLPDYMVPAAFVVLDRAAPEPQRQGGPPRPAGAGRCPATRPRTWRPRTPAEEIVAGIFAEVLEAERVGAGRRLLRAGRALAAGHARDLAGARGVRRGAAPARPVRGAHRGAAGRARGGAWARPARRPPPGARAAAPRGRPAALVRAAAAVVPGPAGAGQRRLQHPRAVRLTGALDVRALERALAEIVRRHEALRTRFPGRGRRAGRR